jgi:hypothetical protein
MPESALRGAPAAAESSFDGCLIDDVVLGGKVVSLLLTGGLLRMWEPQAESFISYVNRSSELQLDYPGRGAVELLERWQHDRTPVSAHVRLFEGQVYVQAGDQVVAGLIPQRLIDDVLPF